MSNKKLGRMCFCQIWRQNEGGTENEKISKVQLKPELVEKIAECATPEELIALAKAQDMELSLDEAKSYLAYLDRDLTEEELARVAGGVEWTCDAEECLAVCSPLSC